MSWDCYHAKYYKEDGSVDTKKECIDYVSHYGEVLDSALIGTIFYAAVKREDDSVTAYVLFTSDDPEEREHLELDDEFNFGVADYNEIEGPAPRECPNRILDLLTPTDALSSNEWRQDCRQYNEFFSKMVDLTVDTTCNKLLDIFCDYPYSIEYIMSIFHPMIDCNVDMMLEDIEKEESKESDKTKS